MMGKSLLMALMNIAIALALQACVTLPSTPSAPGVTATPQPLPSAFIFKSNAFSLGGEIPVRYTCDGDDLSPPLSWSDAPKNTVSYALLMNNPDTQNEYTHWVLYSIPGELRTLNEGVAKQEHVEEVGVQGRNDFGKIGYNGPCPPKGQRHHYRFTMYALDSTLSLQPGATKAQLLSAMQGHIIGIQQLNTTYQRRTG